MNLFAASAFLSPSKKNLTFPEKKNNDWGKCLGLPHTGYGPDKKNVTASSLDKKQHQTEEITSVQGQNYYVRNFKFKLGHFIRLFHGYNLYNSWEKCSTFSHITLRVHKSLLSCWASYLAIQYGDSGSYSSVTRYPTKHIRL